MRIKFILTVVGLLILFGIGNYYMGLRLWQSVGAVVAPGLEWYYWIVFWILAVSYFIGRIGAIYFPGDFSDKMIWGGAFLLGVEFYLCLLWLLYDSVVITSQFFGFLSRTGNYYSISIGLSILITAIALVTYGAHRARTTKVRHYDITINKKVASWPELHVVMISDLHLGLLVGKERLVQAVQIINDLNPDVVLMPGDILDENIGAFVENGMPEILRGIVSRLGVFGILGSHEYVYGHSEKVITWLQQAGITIIRDNYIKVANEIYIVGRDDLFRKQLVGTPRQALSTILTGCNRELPLILMDHQPVDLAEAQLEGIDLQLSGHTHHGQIFPISLLTQALFEIDWGYLRKDRYQIIVSSGYGTWGPPIRLGTSSEIVDIIIKFDKS